MIDLLLTDPKKKMKIKDMSILKDQKLTANQYLQCSSRTWWEDKYYPDDFNIGMVKLALDTGDAEFISKLDNYLLPKSVNETSFTIAQYILLIKHTRLLKDICKTITYLTPISIEKIKALQNVIFDYKHKIDVFVEDKNDRMVFPDFEYELLLVRNNYKFLLNLPRIHPCHQMIVQNPYHDRMLSSTYCDQDLIFQYE